MNNIFTSKLANTLLSCNNLKFPMYNSHYMTGSDICMFGRLACIENTLTCLTCNIKGICNNLKCGIRR